MSCTHGAYLCHMFRIFILVVITLFSQLCFGEVIPGAARTDLYIAGLKGKRTAFMGNHTSMVGDEHTLDLLLRHGVDVKVIFSPEHGFRGTADAGEHVAGGVDAKTGIRIVSLYTGGKNDPGADVMSGIDVVVIDIQDVGLRFYTYYIAMLKLMNVAAVHGVEVLVLDRPNPNGMTVDGPVLDMSLKSGVGALPIPVLHGMTLGELAEMIVGEKWLSGERNVELDVIPCAGYTHATRYELPVAPSPNLRSMQAIYLYPSICLFEGTVASLGRGTDTPFCVYGHPAMQGCGYSFTPRSVPGAKNPPLRDKLCHGVNLNDADVDSIIAGGVDLGYVIDAYKRMKVKSGFFTPFFDKLIGSRKIRPMIESGMNADDIKATWRDDVERFCKLREPYLIYPLY